MKFTIFVFLTMLFVANVSCDKPSQKAQPAAKHYQLKGKVVSIDQQGRMVNIDNEPIPGFMESMTMPYQVKPESELNKLHPGDQISANLMVQDENAWLENISITNPASPGGKK